MALVFGQVPPMLAQLVRKPFNDPNYYVNLKFDGTRCIAFVNKQGFRLQNRRLNELTSRYPDFYLQKQIRSKSAVIDGEIVVFQKGVPSFALLQQREQQQKPFNIQLRAKRIPATLVVFDILEIDGKSVMRKPLIERVKLLKKTLRPAPNLLLADYVDGNGAVEYHRNALKRGFEGIMLKRKDSLYYPGSRSDAWFKVKRFGDIDAILVGWIESEKMPSNFRSLVCAVYDKGKLHYIGNVGSGFDQKTYDEILQELRKREIRKSPFMPAEKVGPSYWKVHWAKLEIVGKVEFHEINPDGKWRAPRFKGLRWDKAPSECKLP